MEGDDTMITMQRAQEKGKKDVKVIRKFTDAGIEVQMICEDVVSEQFFSRNWIKSNGTSQHLYWFFLSSTTVLHIQKNEKAQKNLPKCNSIFHWLNFWQKSANSVRVWVWGRTGRWVASWGCSLLRRRAHGAKRATLHRPCWGRPAPWWIPLPGV